MIKTCCPRDCPKRSATCRTDCPDWQAYEKAKSEEYRQRQERHEYENYKADTIRKARERGPENEGL